MNYLDAITKRAEELDVLAREYLDSLEFIDNQEVMNRIFSAAERIFKQNNEDWDKIPEWAASTLDYHIPFSKIPSNGSLYFMMGFSSISMDAHLRNLLEIAEGRTEKELDFEVIADKSIVESYCYELN
jgi:hypothetical protein